MELLGSTESKITKDQNAENVPHLEINELVLVHLILLIMIISKIQDCYKPFGSLLEIWPRNHIFSKTVNSEFQEIKIWFTDLNSKPLEIEDKINLTLTMR